MYPVAVLLNPFSFGLGLSAKYRAPKIAFYHSTDDVILSLWGHVMASFYPWGMIS